MHAINLLNVELQLLPERAIYIEKFNCLLVSDVHLGKSETFQTFGVPIPSQVNHETLNRLRALCSTLEIKKLIILGDLFHSRLALTETVLNDWSQFLQDTALDTTLILGNHDRPLLRSLNNIAMSCVTEVIQLDNIILSHEPNPQSNHVNICGHIHPCVRIKTRLDQLRLPCFYLEHSKNLLVLPSFGEFTGGYDVQLKPGTSAYVVVEDTVVPFNSSNRRID
jgi:uncharacterized protein